MTSTTTENTFFICDGHGEDGNVQLTPGQEWDAAPPSVTTMDEAEEFVRECLDAGTVRDSYAGRALVVITARDEDDDIVEERVVEVRA